MSLDARLLAICNLSYLPEFSGPFTKHTPYTDAAGFLERPMVVAGGDFGVNVALIGRIPEGLVICYRGTLAFDNKMLPEAQRILDWCVDFHAELKPWYPGTGLCHSGFSAAVESIAGKVEAATSPGMRIYTGHSKGGALAQLAALRYCQIAHRPAVCTTFGAPRCGNEDFVEALSDSPVSLMRYEAAGDVVPHVPFEPRVAEMLAKVFGRELPRADYMSAGRLAFVHADGTATKPLSPLAELAAAGDSILEVATCFASHGFAGVRAAHSIEPASLYWKGVCG